ncbi:putative leucine-rich repeat domain, L domain-containing protein [Rosa chinensis]|uniref:Putative leucine-rich repeat domain, L domain-containing protein n=1 Tax=Rosa chinensis TaxID=74649 RepID=A0A2P6SPQ7_ROSCH|nr:putative leucine-rich repeat domain, L domain-containing protein [Rosa chinensis]
MFKDFKLLRVLKFEWMRSEVELPNEIGNMIHLRYFSLRYSNIKRLPSSVANLTCLQTLDFRAFVTLESPNVVGRMKQLRHLYFRMFGFTIGKQKLSSLGNLQTLDINFK